MATQTKLSPFQKCELRDLREMQDDSDFRVFHFPENRITVGVRYVKGHNCARVFTSIASPEETKFRKKVGEYFVRKAFYQYQHFLACAGNPYRLDNENETHESIANLIARITGDNY